MKIVALLMLLFSLNAFSSIEEYCNYFEHGFCVTRGSDIKNSKAVLIYLRGHWNYRGNVPTPELPNSIEQALNYYDLRKNQKKVNLPMIVSSSSHLSLNISKLEELGVDDSKEIILASHSGGYLGLLYTLSNLKNSSYKIKKIIMLDNFYFGKASTPLIKSYIDQGSECNGFYTQHNEARLEQRFLPEIPNELCPIQKKKYHNQDVNDCLAQYIQGESCL